MTDLGTLYSAIAARMALVPGLTVKTRVPALELARSRPSQPLAALNWGGADAEDAQVIGRGAQNIIQRWEIDIIAPGDPAARLAAEDQAYDMALAILDQLAPVDHSWKPAADCGYIELESIVAMGDVQSGYAVALLISHSQWRE